MRHKTKEAFLKNRRTKGIALVWSAIMLIVLLLITGLSIDGARVYLDLGEYYIEAGLRDKDENKIRKSEALFKKSIAIDPENDRAYGALALSYQTLKEYRLADENFKKANRLRSRFYSFGTVNNYYKLKQILDKHNIKFVIAQYPIRSVASLKEMFEGQKDIHQFNNEVQHLRVLGSLRAKMSGLCQNPTNT